jgi:hypothetical protein
MGPILLSNMGLDVHIGVTPFVAIPLKSLEIGF